jgi:single-strand DNA-binding protein
MEERVMSMNVVALAGRLSRPAVEKVLESGDRLVALEVTVRADGQKAESVPVVWFGAPASAAGLDVEEAVVVVGRVRRRFFKAGERTQSRTEVVADAVVPATQRKRVEAALRKAHASLGEALLG